VTQNNDILGGCYSYDTNADDVKEGKLISRFTAQCSLENTCP